MSVGTLPTNEDRRVLAGGRRDSHGRRAAGPARLGAALRDLKDGFLDAELWLYLGWRDILRHYSRSVLGPFWLTLSMGVLVFSLGLLYSQIFRMEIHDYLPFLAVGFILWNFVSGSITGACHVFSGAGGHIRQIRLPLSIHVFRFVWTQIVTFAHNVAIYVVVALVFSLKPGLGVLLVLPALLVLAANAVFAAMILGPLSARFRDTPMIVASVVQVLFFLTPIIWSAEQLPERAHLVQFNPFYHFIELARDPLLGTTIRGGNWIAAAAITLLHGAIALVFFSRSRSRIAYWV